jgi:hypothetical protein
MRTEYENCNINFRRRRTESARRANALKALAYTEAGGAYNYEERRRRIQKRFLADFGDAQERLAAIRKGLTSIYGYDLQLPDGEGIFDETLIAVRDALDWLVRFSSQEQNYVLPVSVKCLSGNRWDSGLRSDGRAGVWEFVITEDLFPKQSYIRLRGISACVDVNNDSDFFQIAIRLPQQGRIRFLDGTVHQLDQTMVPVTRVARIQPRSSVRPPDVVGVLSLHNVSPIGIQSTPWRLVITSEVEPLQITADPTGDAPDPHAVFVGSNDRLQDVILFLHLAVRTEMPAKSKIDRHGRDGRKTKGRR